MSQVIVEDVAADLTAILTQSDGNPALGILYTDVVVEFRKEGVGSFSSKSLTPTAAELTSGNSETYTLSDAQTLLVAVDGAAAQTATFNTADFSDIGNATAAEVAAVITTDITGATAADVGGFVVIISDTTGDTSEIQVTGGTANTELGFSTTAVNGSTFWKEIGSGIYTIEFTASELDTPGSFTFKVTGATINQFVGIVTINAAGNTQTVVSLNTCILTGHLFDLSGKAIQNAAINAKVIGFPTILNQTGVTDRSVSTLTDVNGEFFLKLVRTAEVHITIPEISYSRIITVPNQATANLFSDIN